jgi:glutathione S-transferase
MKLYDSLGPNPRLVRMFIGEKGLEIPLVQVDLMGAENRAEAFRAKNPAGQTPVLELDDGTCLAETVAICEYLEDLRPEPRLIGATPEERAATRMWTRRAELHVTIPLADGFRFAEGLPLFKGRIRTIPQAADDLKAIAQAGLGWMDRRLAEVPYLCGERYTLADILLFAFVEFGAQVGQRRDPTLAHLAAWYDRVAARPSTLSTVRRD